MQELKIVHKRIGYSNATLLIKNSKAVLIDTGVKGNLNVFKIWFRQFNLKPTDLKLIILTHTHYDHTGNLTALKKFTGAPVLVHQNEFENLKNGFTPIPKGQGNYSKFISGIGRTILPKFASPKPFLADLINENEFDLNALEIDGKVIFTPGHTHGSQSVLLEEKLISGDTFINIKNGIIFPHFADDPQTLLKTWEMLFDLKIKEIYPGHGPKFNVKKAFPEYEKWKQKIT